MLTVADMGEGGVKNGQKSADVLYGRPQTTNTIVATTANPLVTTIATNSQLQPPNPEIPFSTATPTRPTTSISTTVVKNKTLDKEYEKDNVKISSATTISYLPTTVLAKEPVNMKSQEDAVKFPQVTAFPTITTESIFTSSTVVTNNPMDKKSVMDNVKTLTATTVSTTTLVSASSPTTVFSNTESVDDFVETTPTMSSEQNEENQFPPVILITLFVLVCSFFVCITIIYLCKKKHSKPKDEEFPLDDTTKFSS